MAEGWGKEILGEDWNVYSLVLKRMVLILKKSNKELLKNQWIDSDILEQSIWS